MTEIMTTTTITELILRMLPATAFIFRPQFERVAKPALAAGDELTIVLVKVLN